MKRSVDSVKNTITHHGIELTDRNAYYEEMSLRSSSGLLEASLDSMEDIFYVFTPDGSFVDWNETFTAVTGYTDEELSDLHPTDLVVATERKAMNEALDTVTRDLTAVTFVTVLETKTGNHIPYEFQWAPVGEEDGADGAVTGIGREITDRNQLVAEQYPRTPDSKQPSVPSQIDNRQAENEQLGEKKESLQTELEKTTKDTLEFASEMEERYQQPFESAFDGICLMTESLDEYVMANLAFADLLGYESGEALCTSVDSIEEDVFVNPDKYERYSETLQANGEINQFEYQVYTADGEIQWVSDSVRPLTDDEGAVEGYRSMVTDISEKKKQEGDLKRQTNLSIVLNRVLRHNLRNDITVIRGFTQMMADKLDDNTNGERALSTIDSLIELIEKARVLDQVIASDANPEPADIPALIEGVATQKRREYPSATISVVAEEGEEITAKVLPSFKRAIEELLENAVKHSGDEPRAEVTIEANYDDVQIRIADNGPGIEDQEASVLGTGSETPLTHGSGLGLWLTNWIVTSQEGVINATATDEGTTLSVSVPRTPSSEGGQRQLADMVRARDQYKSAFEEAGDGMTITDDEGRILDVNKKAAQIYGVERQALLGRPIREFISDDFDFEAEWGKIKAAEMKRGEMNIVTADGGVSPIEFTAKSHIVPGQHLIASRDITERKEREKEIQEREAKYRSLFEDSRDALMLLDRDGFFDCNERTLELFGFDSVDAFVSHAPWDVSPARQPDGSESEQQAKRHVETAFETGEAFYEWTHKKRDGTEFQAEVKLSLFYHHGDPAIHAVVRDISERKEREQELERYETIVETAGDPVYTIDSEAHITAVNEALVEITGYQEETLLGEHVSIVISPEHIERGEALIRELLKSSRDHGTFEMDIITASGQRIPCETHIGLVPYDEEFQGTVGVVRDITERKEQQDRLRKEQKQFKALFDQFPEPTTAVNVENGNTVVQAANSAFEEVFGYDADELIGESINDLIVPADKQEEALEIDQLSQDGELVDREVTRKTRHGEREFQFKNIPIPGDADTDMYGVYENITELKEREQELHEETRQNKRLLEYSSDYLFVVDESMEVSYISPSVERVLGYTPDEVTGAPSLEFTHPDDVEIATEAFAEILEGPNEDVTVEFRTRHADGGYRWMEVRGRNLLDDPVIEGVLVNARDITQRKEREQELQEKIRQNERFKTLIDHTSDIIFVINETGNISYINSAVEEILDYPPGELVGQSGFDIIHPEDLEQARGELTKTIEDSEHIGDIQIRAKQADGSTVDLDVRASNHLENPNIEGVVVVARDITERKRQEDRFQAFIEQSTDITTVLDPDGTYQYQSPSSKRVLGYEPDELIGETSFEYIHPEDRERVIETFSEAVTNPEITASVEYRFKHKDGTWLWLKSVGNNQLDNPAIEGFIVNSRDITERKEREQRIQRERDRLDKFAGVLSHDLRNPLNVATLRLDLGIQECESEHLEDVAEAHDRMEALIDDVLTLTKAGETVDKSKVVGLAELIEGCWQNVDTKSAELLAETDASIRADKTRLKQLFENLFRNAVEHGGDDVTVTVGDFEGGLYVEDGGPGIPEADRKEVFEAGYSNQVDGTGFGLSIVNEIVRSHDWEIQVTEGSQGGARFEIGNMESAAD